MPKWMLICTGDGIGCPTCFGCPPVLTPLVIAVFTDKMTDYNDGWRWVLTTYSNASHKNTSADCWTKTGKRKPKKAGTKFEWNSQKFYNFHHSIKNLFGLCFFGFSNINSYIISLSLVLWLLGWRGGRRLQSILSCISVNNWDINKYNREIIFSTNGQKGPIDPWDLVSHGVKTSQCDRNQVQVKSATDK